MEEIKGTVRAAGAAADGEEPESGKFTRKAVLFDVFSERCPYFTDATGVNGGYGCSHPDQDETDTDDGGKEAGRCHCFSCPLGTEAEQDDLDGGIDAVADWRRIDWDGLCTDGEVTESEYLLVSTGGDATDDEKQALWNYDRYMHRYDKEWLDAHGIQNGLCA